MGTKNKSMAKCGIFNFEENNWIKIKSYEYYECNDQHSTLFGTLQNNSYSNDTFILSTFGHTAKYDISRNEWYQLTKDANLQGHKFREAEQPKLWLGDNPHILYCAAYSNDSKSVYCSM